MPGDNATVPSSKAAVRVVMFVTPEMLDGLKDAWKFERDLERAHRRLWWRVLFMKPFWKLLDLIEPQ